MGYFPGYFVVFSREMKENVILPASWIKDIEKHLEKFLNNSINRSQVFLCFSPDVSSDAFDDDGCPDQNFEPDFHSINCFRANMKHYFGK